MINRVASLIIPSKPVSYMLLKKEQKICVEFANEMRQLTLQDNFPYIWFHIPNEFLPSAKPNFSFELKLKHMGKMSGIADYCFISAYDSFFVEFKTDKSKQTRNQKIFEEWCAAHNVSYFLCRSAKDGIDLIRTKLKDIHQS